MKASSKEIDLKIAEHAKKTKEEMKAFSKEIDLRIAKHAEETDRKIAEHSKKTDERIKEFSKEIDLKIAKSSEETDKKIEKMTKNIERELQKLAQESQKTERMVQELSQEMKEFKEEMKDFKDEMRAFKEEMKDFKDEMKDFKDEMTEFKKEINKKWGDLAYKLGTVAEDIVAPGVPSAIKRNFNLEVTELSVRRKRKLNSKIREYDVIAVAGNYLFLIDVKSTYRRQYITDFENAIRDFLLFFPEYKGLKIVPVIASLNLTEEIINIATSKNWLALHLFGDYLEFVNKDKIDIFSN
jgi:peptidase E